MKRLFSILAGGLLLSATLAASAAGDRTPSSTSPPIITWQAPAFYTSPHSGRTALTDAASPMPYIPLVPCREYDSRNFTKLMEATPRTVTLSAVAAPPCGIPTTAAAVAVNITVFAISGGSGNGVFKVDTVSPPLTAWINYPSSETQRGNAGVVSTTGGTAAIVVGVYQGGGSVDFTVDVFGYYSPTPANTNDPFTVINPTTNTAIQGVSLGTGVQGISTGPGGWGVEGLSFSTGIGVYGANTIGNGYGVYGVSALNVAVFGQSTSYVGVQAFSTNYDGLYAVGGRHGSNSNGTAFGAIGHTSSTANGLAGVYGVDGAGAGNPGGGFSAGVRGEGKTGTAGYTNTATGVGAFGLAIPPATWGVFSFGDMGATGAKPFVEPHPTDPTMTIRYVALEGPEAGTYFRGTAQTVNGEAVIQVPDTFRIVTYEEGLTVQLTPVGGLAQLAVMSEDLNQIVVRSSRDVTFHYHVNGIRRAFKDWQVVKEGNEFRPVSADQKMPGWLTEDAKSRLIANGTYNPDGTVNMNTAERLGWAKAWRDEAAAAAPAAAATKHN
jgi:hypothetical protein